MPEPQLDLSYQARQGPGFELPHLSGGTGRLDGGSPVTVLPCQNVSGSTIAAGTVVRKANPYPSGPGILVTPATAIGQLIVGVAMESIPDNTTGDVAIMGGPVAVLTTGTITDGGLLAASGTSGRARERVSPTDDTAFAISLNATSGTSSVWAVLLGLFQRLDFSSFPSAVNIVLGDGVNVLTTGEKAHFRWPFAGTLIRNSLLAKESGSIVLDIFKDSFANFPPTVADTITASAKPTLSSDDESEDSTLTGWTKTFAEGDIYTIKIDSVTTITRVTLELKYQRTS